MCGIAMSTDSKELEALIAVNSPRGARIHSVAWGNRHGNITYQMEGRGPLDCVPGVALGEWVIAHQRAPTNASAEGQSHPAVVHTASGKARLWHNGLIKTSEIERIRELYEIQSEWDTEVLLQAIIANGGIPPRVEGSFACLMVWSGQILAFRNPIAPLFYGATGISSVATTTTAFKIKPGIMHNVGLVEDIFNPTRPLKLKLTEGPEFATDHNPYHFEEKTKDGDTQGDV